MKKKRLVLGIDITDWQDEWLREEVEIKSSSDLILCVVDDGHSNAQAARMAIVQRELGIAPDGILKPNKVLLNAGARAQVAVMISNRHTEAEMPNGKMYDVRTYIAPPGRKPADDDEKDESGNGYEAEQKAIAPIAKIDGNGDRRYAQFDTARGLELALRWLERWVPGLLFERFKQIAAAGGDIEAAAEMVKSKIDEMVERLMEPIPM